jgi:uncharacterized linocin/CFP29 family protein
MNNLHRGLVPISDEAWSKIEEEAKRTLKRHLAAGEAGKKEAKKRTVRQVKNMNRLFV